MELLDSPSIKRGKKINFKKEISRYIRNWYWILLSMLFCYMAAQVYLRYATPKYLSKTTLIFPESKSKGSAVLSDLQTLGIGLSGNEELQSETTAIVAKPILSKVVEHLNLNVSFFAQGTIKEPEIYPTSAISGKILSVSSLDFSAVSYIVNINSQDTYTLSEGPLLKEKNNFRFGEPVQLPFGKIILFRKKALAVSSPMKVVFRSTNSWVSLLEKQLHVSLPENKGLLMDLTITGTVAKKSEDILNEITRQYNIEGIKDRSQESQNTQNFINDRLAVITQDLSGIENEKENFKRKNEITDLDAQANIALSNSNENTKQIVALTTQLDLVNSIYDISTIEKLLPSNMGLLPLTEKYIAQYNDLLLKRSNTLKQATSQNPSVLQLNKQISDLRILIRQNLQESRNTLEEQIAKLNGRLNEDRKLIDQYPGHEKMFRSIERQQNLKEQLYLYLLQKREENAITLAVKTPKAKILNPAYTSGIVSPNSRQITWASVGAGFLIPILLMFGRYTLDTHIRNRDDLIAQIPNAVVIAEIPFVEKGPVLFEKNHFTMFAESFRFLASNMRYLLKTSTGNGHKGVLLVTSSVKGEGKTTIAINTAINLSGSCKVLLIGADIRNPQLQRYLPSSSLGLTDFLISKDDDARSYIVKNVLYNNLDVLFSGAIAPNPSDLLNLQKFDDMITSLKKDYDYIILDSAPVILVSDTLHLLDTVDLILYAVKSGFTENEMLDFAIEYENNNSNKKIAFVLNGLKPENIRYGNKYGYGYYNGTTKKSFYQNFYKS